MQNVQLLVIDPQFDFCDPNGALYVSGAEHDMTRLAKMVGRLGNKLSAIHVTLDSHHLVDIAHPIFWVDANGAQPNVFTIITSGDLKNGVYRAKIPSLQQKAMDYVNALEANKRYPLCIWPPHCLIGSNGAKVCPEFFDAITAWESQLRTVNYVTKGSNQMTEHYSAMKADVPDPKDPSTQLNIKLIETLEKADVIVVGGEASSHCLANSIMDIAENFTNSNYVKKIVLLTDATSPVPSFEKFEKDFIKEMTARGMQTSTTVDFLA